VEFYNGRRKLNQGGDKGLMVSNDRIPPASNPEENDTNVFNLKCHLL
jgi:hypothetical protein